MDDGLATNRMIGSFSKPGHYRNKREIARGCSAQRDNSEEIPKNVIGKGRPSRSGQSGNARGRPKKPAIDKLLNRVYPYKRMAFPPR